MGKYVAAWLLFRGLRWFFWIAGAAYYLEVWINFRNHVTPFGQILLSTEFGLFFLPTAGLAMGFLELMMRERADRPRPNAFRDWNWRPQLQPSNSQSTR